MGKKLSKEHKEKIRLASIKRVKEGRGNFFKKGHKSHTWKGGRYKDTYGYVLVFSPDHPYCNAGKYVLEHRLVMEAHLGRHLLPTEVVHHLNSIPDDNRVENLGLYDSQRAHTKDHSKTNKFWHKSPKWIKGQE